MPALSITMTMLRFRISILFSKKSYLGEIRQICFEIMSEWLNECYKIRIDIETLMLVIASFTDWLKMNSAEGSSIPLDEEHWVTIG